LRQFVVNTSYSVSSPHPDKFTIGCGPPKCSSLQPDPDAPWTFMQIHYHEMKLQYHWAEVLIHLMDQLPDDGP